MPRRLRRAAAYVAGAAIVLTAVAIWLRPAPIRVETAAVTSGPMEVTAEEVGETRAPDRYVVATPVAGRLLRVVLKDGDAVQAGQVVALVDPLPLSTREREQLTAHVTAATATLRAAEAQLDRASESLAQARRDATRLEPLTATGAASRQEFERAQSAAVTLERETVAARYRVEAAAADLDSARAALRVSGQGERGANTRIPLIAPASGRVLRVLEPSERVVAAGTPILVVGDLRNLEVVLEMLSSEAVGVKAGMPAQIVDWGGSRPLRARVRLVEPYAFTKVSALGVEEKRTRVVLDFVEPPSALGDGYRVTGRIVTWSAPAVIKAPTAALFRCGPSWCVFVVDRSRARLRRIEIGHRSDQEVEIQSGLKIGERVITHPPSELSDGARVRLRP